MLSNGSWQCTYLSNFGRNVYKLYINSWREYANKILIFVNAIPDVQTTSN